MKKVVVIGAGILGAATAYELAKQKVDVTVIDAHTPGRATSAAAGIICPWISKRRNKAWYTLAVNGAAHYETFITELEDLGETKTGYKKVGSLKLHYDLAKLEELEELAMKRRENAPQIGDVRILTPRETWKMFPLLEEKYYSLYIEGAARVDGNELRDALLRSSKRLGATFIDGKAELLQNDEQITGIKVDGDETEANFVIATNGVWMNQLLAPLQLNIQFQAQKGEILHLQMEDLTTDELPVINPPNNQYILSFDNGKIVAGATHETAFDLHPTLTAGGMHYLLEEGLKMAPGLQKATISETRVGFRPFTYNHLPIFGPIPGVDGLMIANGLGASGLTTGPYIGKQLTNMALNRTTDIDIEPYKVELGKH